MNLRREDTLEDYEIKHAIEQEMQRSGQRAQQLNLKFEPAKKQPRPVNRHRVDIDGLDGSKALLGAGFAARQSDPCPARAWGGR